MGMFDWVNCEVPLPDGYAGQFQTKCFGCTMATLTITADGRLTTDDYSGSYERGETREIDFHGVFEFYDFDKNADPSWREYRAKFTDGRLVNIAASGMEAGTVETEGLDAKHDSPVPKADAQ